MSQTVTSGPFTFYPRSRLDEIRVAFVATTPDYTRGLAGASVNGESFTFFHDGVEYQREEFAALLQDAYIQLGETKYGYPHGNRTAASFNSGGNYWALVQPARKGFCGPMAGGNLATTSDSRGKGFIYNIHDRFETQDLNDALSQ